MKSLTKFIPLFFIVCCLPWNLVEAETWAEAFVKKIEEIPQEPSLDDVLLLAKLAANDAEESDVQEVKALARKRLDAIPDFPDRLAQRIHRERERWSSGKGPWSNYDRERMWTLQPMAKLPDPGIVRILGTFLDDWEWPGYQGDPRHRPMESGMVAPNCIFAAKALGQLIEKAPIQKNWDDYWFDDVEVWQLWYAQVKAGTRTFRFKGDPQDYNLHGPVSKTIEPADPRPPNHSETHSPAPAVSPKNTAFSWRALAAACAALGAALWYLIRNSKRRLA